MAESNTPFEPGATVNLTWTNSHGDEEVTPVVIVTADPAPRNYHAPIYTVRRVDEPENAPFPAYHDELSAVSN